MTLALARVMITFQHRWTYYGGILDSHSLPGAAEDQ